MGIFLQSVGKSSWGIENGGRGPSEGVRASAFVVSKMGADAIGIMLVTAGVIVSFISYQVRVV